MSLFFLHRVHADHGGLDHHLHEILPEFGNDDFLLFFALSHVVVDRLANQHGNVDAALCVKIAPISCVVQNPDLLLILHLREQLSKMQVCLMV